MAIIRGRAKTASGSRYLQQLCKHWGHKFDVEFSATRGQVRFPAAVATMEASADALLVCIETEDVGSVERLKEVVANHLDRFAFREAPLPFEWSATDGRVWTPLRMQEVFRELSAQVQVLPCVRPV
jgi:hypothetical protein